MKQLQVATLHELEVQIEAGLETFIEVGLCLLEIRDRRLHKEAGHTRFEDYCRIRWGFGKSRIYQLIEAAKMSTIVDEMPKTESQARELAPLAKADPDEAIRVLQELKEEYGDGVTAEKIRQAVREILKPEEMTQQLPSPKNEASDTQYMPQEEEIIIPKIPHVSHNSGNNEWYTPAEYIEAARRVMGTIEIDPASSHKANETVKAQVYYTAEDDGLSKHWKGKVWMNPPYAGELIPQFCSKLSKHFSESDISEAIVLVNNATETAWFNILINQASAIIFPKSRVKYYTPSGETGTPLQGQAVIYFGNNIDRFMTEFRRFGWGACL